MPSQHAATHPLAHRLQALWRAPLRRWGWVWATTLHLALALVPALRQAPQWGDDFAAYVLQALCVVEGRAQTDCGYRYSPEALSIGPAAYPMGYPLLLAPLVARWGVDFDVLTRWAQLLTALLGVALLLWLRRLLQAEWPAALLSLALVLNPGIWLALRHVVESDVPFALLLLLGWAYVPAPTTVLDSPRRALGIGLFFAALSLLRSVGVLFMGGYMLALLLAGGPRLTHGTWRQRLGVVSVGAMVLAGWLGPQLLVQQLWPVGAISEYAEMFGRYFSSDVPWRNLVYYLDDLGRWLVRGEGGWLSAALGLGLLLSVLTLRRQLSIGPQWFVIGGMAYASLLLLWATTQPDRFTLPLALWLLGTVGAALISIRSGVTWGLVVVGLLLVLPWSPLLAQRLGVSLPTPLPLAQPQAECPLAVRGGPRPVTDTPLEAEMQTAWAAVRRHTPAEAVLYFAKPRACALFTGRASMGLSVCTTADQIGPQLARIGTTHLLIHPELTPAQVEAWVNLAATAGQLRLVWHSARHRLYARVIEPSAPVGALP